MPLTFDQRTYYYTDHEDRLSQVTQMTACRDGFVSIHDDRERSCVRVWQYRQDDCTKIAYHDGRGCVQLPNCATFQGVTCYLGWTSGHDTAIRFDPRKTQVIEESFRLELYHKKRVVHLSIFENHLLSCSRRTLTVVDLERPEFEPHLQATPFPSHVNIRKARGWLEGSTKYLLLAGLDPFSQLYVLARRWNFPMANSSTWHPWGDNAGGASLSWQSSGRMDLAFSVKEVLDITSDGRVLVTDDASVRWQVDLRTRLVTRLGNADSSPWPDSTADPGFPAVVACRKRGRDGEAHFEQMMDTQESPSVGPHRDLMDMTTEMLLLVKESIWPTSIDVCEYAGTVSALRLTCKWWYEVLRQDWSRLSRHRQLRDSVEFELDFVPFGHLADLEPKRRSWTFTFLCDRLEEMSTCCTLRFRDLRSLTVTDDTGRLSHCWAPIVADLVHLEYLKITNLDLSKICHSLRSQSLKNIYIYCMGQQSIPLLDLGNMLQLRHLGLFCDVLNFPKISGISSDVEHLIFQGSHYHVDDLGAFRSSLKQLILLDVHEVPVVAFDHLKDLIALGCDTVQEDHWESMGSRVFLNKICYEEG